MSTDPFFSALQTGAVRWPQQRALLRVTGADARGFLHRMSTQHVEALSPGEARLNALTNKQGRIVDVVHQLALADDEVLLIGTRDAAAPLVAWLDDFLFVEKVTLEDRTGQGSLAVVAGGRAFAVVSTLLGRDVALGPWAAAGEGDIAVVRSFDLLAAAGPVPSLLVYSHTRKPDALAIALDEAGAALGSPADLEVVRVTTGVPGPREASDRHNPLELALHDAIHWAKGCYIGQEVIARIDNYGKQARQLVGLVVDDERAHEHITLGAEVRAGDKPIGEVTSVSPRFREGSASALAVLKLRGDVADTPVEVVGASDRVAARVQRRAAEQQPHD